MDHSEPETAALSEPISFDPAGIQKAQKLTLDVSLENTPFITGGTYGFIRRRLGRQG